MSTDSEHPAIPQEEAAETRRPIGLARALLASAVALLLLVALYNALLGRSLGNQEVYLFGQDRWMPGTAASLRVVLLRHRDQHPIDGASVRILLARPRAEILELASGRTNAAGTLDASFTVPEGEGQARLLVKAESRWGQDFIDRPIRLATGFRVYLTTDRPAYRTGQKIRLRAWVARRDTGAPAAGQSLRLHAFAPNEVLILSRPLRTDEHGTVSSDVDIAPRAPAGTYRVKVSAGASAVEQLLPVSANPDPPFPISLNNVSVYSTPGGLVHGAVHATDTLGSPLRGASTRVWLETTAGRTVSWTSGSLDARGTLGFGLPAPPRQEPERLRLRARVTDASRRSAHAMQAVIVTPQLIQLAAIPESGTLIPGVENRLYLVARYPDGTPAAVTYRYVLNGTRGSADSGPLGIATLTCTPGNNGATLALSASDRSGHTGLYEATLPAVAISQTERDLRERYRRLTDRRATGDARPMLLRPERGIYAHAATLRVEILSPGPDTRAYVDLYAEDQTVLTREVALRSGHGSLAVRLPDSLLGLVWVRAYCLGAWGDATRAQRAIYILPPHTAATSLRLSRPNLQPGDPARINLQSGPSALTELNLTRAPASLVPSDATLAIPSSLQAPALPGGTLVTAVPPQARDAEWQAAASAALALSPPPEGWSLQQDVYATKQARLQARRAILQLRLRWAVLVFLALFWLFAARAIVRTSSPPSPAAGDGDTGEAGAEASAVGAESGDTGPKEAAAPENAAPQAAFPAAPGNPPPLRFLLLTAGVALAAMLLISLTESRPAQRRVNPVGSVAAALARERRARAAALSARESPFPPAVPASLPVPEVGLWTTLFHADGQATYRFVAPSEPGLWALSATTLARDGLLTRAATPVPISADFMIACDPPPVARPGDTIGVTARIRNALTTTEEIRVKLMASPGLAVQDEPILTEKIPGGAGITRAFRVGVGGEPGTAALTLMVTGRRDVQATRREIRILPAIPDAGKVRSGRLGQPASLSFEVRESPQEASLSLQMSPATVAAAHLADLQHLPPLSALHRAAVVDLARIALSPEDRQGSPPRLALGRAFQELLSCADDAGGFAAFPGQKPDAMSTAFAAMVLDAAQGALPGARAVALQARLWLREHARADGSWPAAPGSDSATTSAFVAWCLGDGAAAARIAAPWLGARRGERSRASRAGRSQSSYLLSLIAPSLLPSPSAPPEGSGTAAARTLRERLAAQGTTLDGERCWMAESTVDGLSAEASALETTAMAVLALARDPRCQQMIADAVPFLAERRASASPFAADLAVRALQAADPAARALQVSSGERSPGGSATVLVNGKLVGRLSAQIPAMDLRPYLVLGTNTLELRPDRDSAPFYELSLSGGVTLAGRARRAPTLTASFAPLLARAGQTVTFSARVSGGPSRLVTLDVPIPAGIRPVRDDLEELVQSGAAETFLVGAGHVFFAVDLGRRRQARDLSFRLVAVSPCDVQAPAPSAYAAADPSARAFGGDARIRVESTASGDSPP